MVTQNVQDVLDMLKKNPQLLKQLELVITMMYEKANKNLNDAEKEELFKELGTLAKPRGVTG